ncbi:restriction endonuclease subunit S [Paenibacillus thiaminolyticus]|uniref:restriction endonuclease subunit S n=1 Tax=Paenibacillus thiaminolyticus TaxID=49283 RepID=UPI00232B569A|nr:restriction endonuclease subunit S [Paenibacillus thiaminolyticus]WCF07661.1 restriction endonuclease subunit S [Paenibacillus thiaminolyticus]
MSFKVFDDSWEIKTLGELLLTNKIDIQTGPFGTMLKASSYTTEGVPVIAVKDIGINKIIHGQSPLIDNIDADRISKYKLQTNDIVFGRKGAVDRRALITEKEKGWIQGSDCIRVRFLDASINPIFVSYFLGTKYYYNWIMSNAQGTTMPSLNQEILKRVPIPIPPIDDQGKIVLLLKQIDNKIELNNDINKNLEEMAQVLFKHWFVGFEFPNENGEPYKSSGGEFEESELGMIPKGWKVHPLNEVLEINPKRTLKKGCNAPYVEMRSITNYYARVTEHTNREFKSGTKFINGDVLLARITPCLENGKTAYVDFLEENQVGWGSTEYIILRSRQGIPNLFAYFLARSDEFRSHAITNMTGTSGRQRVPETSVSSYLIAIPDTFELFKKFGDVVQAGFELMKKNDLETHSLKHIRDTLLPKLMSGELRIPLDQA